MATLHTVNKSPFERNALQSCLQHVSAGDTVLMIEDAVIGARKGSAAAAMLEAAMQTGTVAVLGADLAARPEDGRYRGGREGRRLRRLRRSRHGQ